MMTIHDPRSDASSWEARLEVVQDGAPRERDRLLDDLRGRMVPWARAMAGDLDAAEDLVQEALVRISQSIDDLRPEGEGGLLAWSWRVLRNVHVDRTRTSSRRRRLTAERSTELPRPSAPAPYDPTSIVHRYLDELSETQRTALLLVDLEGRPSPEVAELMEVEPSTLRVHLHRARRTIRARILEDFA